MHRLDVAGRAFHGATQRGIERVERPRPRGARHFDGVEGHAVVAAATIYRTIADLKALGAEGILVTRIERLMA